MSGIRTSFLPKGSKKDAKESKNQHATQDHTPAQVAPTPLAVQPQAPFGHQQQFEAHAGQYGSPPLQYGQQQQQYQQQQQQQPSSAAGQVPGTTAYSGANFINPVSGLPGTSSPVSQRESIIGATPSSSAPPVSTTAPAQAALAGRQDSFQSEASAQVATPQFQQHSFQQQPGQQFQQHQQQQFQQQQQQQQQQQHQSPYATNAVQSTVPAIAPVLQQQQQQPPTSVAPTIVTPAIAEPEPQGAQITQENSLRRLSNSSFNNTTLSPETLGAASAASAAIHAARLSTSGSPVSTPVKADNQVFNPYQLIPNQQQQQQQPMVTQQEQRQQAPGSPLSDAGSRISVQSGASEVRNLDVIARAQAMFDFPGEDPGDLPFKVGDIINVIEFCKSSP